MTRFLRMALGVFIGAILLLALLVLAVAAAALGIRSDVNQPPPPQVVLHSPSFGDAVGANDEVLVRGNAASTEAGITRVELWVDGALLAVRESQLPGGSTPFPFMEMWLPGTPGAHTLVVRAYDADGRDGQTTVLVQAEDRPRTPPSDTHMVEEGETLERLGQELEVPPEAIAALNPDLTGDPQPGTEIRIPTPSAGSEDRGEEPPVPVSFTEAPDPIREDESLLGGLTRLIPAGLLGPLFDPDPGDFLEVEAISFQVHDDYDGVWCYVSIPGLGLERIPAEGSFGGGDEWRWDVEAEMGPAHRRLIVVPPASQVYLTLRCLGYRATPEGDALYDLGTMIGTHPESDWDGRHLHRNAYGEGGWFDVDYRIWPAGESGYEGELPAPVLSAECFQRWDFFETAWCTLSWTYPFPTPPGWEHIDGYLVLRNGSLLLQTESPTAYPVYLFERGEGWLPPCGETWEYQVVAYHGNPLMGPPDGVRSAASNSVFVGPETTCAQGRTVFLTLNYLHVCSLDVDCSHYCGLPACLDTRGIGGPSDESHCGGDIGCDPDYADLYGTYAYGSISVNGERMWSAGDTLNSGHIYQMRPGEGITRVFHLAPDDSLTISSAFYDYDAMTDDDPFCVGDYEFLPEHLVQIRDAGGRTDSILFNGGDGACFLNYSMSVMGEVLPAPDYERPAWP